MLEKHGCSVKELKSELYYSSTLCQVVFHVLHYANLIVAHAPTVWTVLIPTICLRMHSKLKEELNHAMYTCTHSHLTATTLTQI